MNFSRIRRRQRSATRCSPPVNSVVSPNTRRRAERIKLVECIADGWVGTAARGRVRLTYLVDTQAIDRTFFALKLTRPLHIFPRHFDARMIVS